LALSNRYWKSLLISLALGQVAASLLMPRGDVLTIISDLIQGALLLMATAAFLPKTTHANAKSFRTRLFWILMSVGMGLWLAYQGMWNYFEVVKRQDVPDPFLGDIVLFLHLVPMIAALGVLPHLREDERDERIRILDFSLLLTWWVFIYVYLVIPWQTVQIDEPTYSTNLNLAYLTEKLMLLVGLAVLAYSAEGGWRQLYGQLLGASALYASSSYVATWAIGHKTYYTGSIYDIPLTVSIAWIAAVPALSGHYDLSESDSAKPLLGVWITRLSMLALFSLPWVALHSELDATQPHAVKAFRVTVSLAAMIVMGVMVFWRQRMLGDDLSFLIDKSRRSFDELKNLQESLIQSQKLASLGQLVGGAAHEINNPLTAMLGYSELLSVSGLPPHEEQQALMIGDQVRRTKTLVESLLTFVRPAPAKLMIVDVNSVLRTALRLLPSRLQVQGVAVRPELAPSLPPVLADSNQLLHVCLHLAGQISVQLDPGTNCSLCIRTGHEGGSLLVDFFAEAPFLGPPSFDLLLTSEGVHRPDTLSLNACCRIVEEQGGRLLRPSNLTIPAFRVELSVAANSATGHPNRAAAHGGS
jgi:signal transduction histidine kinase